ncbi:hypothetical protein [Sicyoidochytrium minutum DNA virus]|nr:hypothetical protein [Sicyoidochytrium minutum DNA virus]BDC17041.1 hypothetical protein [Sicyoidochytrium minutum DNA virus]
MSLLNAFESYVRPDLASSKTVELGSVSCLFESEIIAFLDPKSFVALAATNKTWQAFMRYLVQADMTCYELEDLFRNAARGFSTTYHGAYYPGIDSESLNFIMAEFDECAFRERNLNWSSRRRNCINKEYFRHCNQNERYFDQKIHCMRLYADYEPYFEKLFRAWWFVPSNIQDVASWGIVLFSDEKK